jgi:hypothetical protein
MVVMIGEGRGKPSLFFDCVEAARHAGIDTRLAADMDVDGRDKPMR